MRYDKYIYTCVGVGVDTCAVYITSMIPCNKVMTLMFSLMLMFQITVPLLTGTGTNKTAALKLETEVGNKTNPISSHKVNNVDSLQATVNGAENIYWVDYARLRGNLLGIYGNTLEFKVHFTAATGVPRVPRCVIVGHKNAKFIFELPKVNVSQTTTLKVTFREELLSTSAMGKNVTRGQFLLGLSDVQKVMLPAVFYDKTQLTSIGDIKYTIASQQASPFGIRSKAVEQCSCPAGYSGLSCEVSAIVCYAIFIQAHFFCQSPIIVFNRKIMPKKGHSLSAALGVNGLR